MEKGTVRDKMKASLRFPQDIHLYGERDFTFFISYRMAQLFVSGVARYLGRGYRMCAIVCRSGKMGFYRSRSDELAFSRHVGEQCLQEPGHAEFMASRLKELSDALMLFIKRERSLAKEDYSRFLGMFDEQFAYHLAVFWAGDYIAGLQKGKEYAAIAGLLDHARVYNERIIPQVNDWIRRQGDAQYWTPEEVESSFARTPISSGELKRRKECAFIFGDRKGIYLSSGPQALRDAASLDRSAFRGVKRLMKSGRLEGLPVFPGIYRGRARIIDQFDKFSLVKKGEVIVAPMTRPHLNKYIRGAGAIVTDEGAVLCHAAIVARELKIPCVIGTKIATKVLHDGDIVEVDANKGIVRGLKAHG